MLHEHEHAIENETNRWKRKCKCVRTQLHNSIYPLNILFGLNTINIDYDDDDDAFHYYYYFVLQYRLHSDVYDVYARTRSYLVHLLLLMQLIIK